MHLVFSVNQPGHIGFFPASARGVWSALELENRVRQLPPLDDRLAHLDAAADITQVLGPLYTISKGCDHEIVRVFKSHLKPNHGTFNFVRSRAFKCSVKAYRNGFSTECYFITIHSCGPFYMISKNKSRVVRFWNAMVSPFCVKPTALRWVGRKIW